MKRLMVFCVLAAGIGLVANAFAAADGAAIYKAKCSLCHGPEAQGTPMAPGFKGSEFLMSGTDEQIADAILKGREGAAKKYKQFPMGMPKQVLKEDELKAVTDYIKDIAKKK